MTELENYLHHYFSIGLHDGKKLAGLFQEEKLAKGDFFLKSQQQSNRLSFIQHGLLRLFVTLPDKEVTQWIANSGTFVTDLSGFLFRNPSRWNIQALSEVTLYTISHEQYLNIGQLIPKWNEFEKLFIGKCFVSLENRMFNQISLSAEERYQILFEEQRELFHQVPLQYLASMLGMTPETLSRIRNKKTS
ncbi:Crp/Fnr family transcriptional regulator [Pedobacter gandavensis]|uniref:Crp/Fnr family transcriptional regulator n=1 Tax=Pedobacter gandavensis TaxID=2679963 RepID=UPI00292FD31D|nr:Crp/Fnr family transcriptional regulator [Pedobacter gandavensis]